VSETPSRLGYVIQVLATAVVTMTNGSDLSKRPKDLANILSNISLNTSTLTFFSFWGPLVVGLPLPLLFGVMYAGAFILFVLMLWLISVQMFLSCSITVVLSKILTVVFSCMFVLLNL
jgi:hypothetical protein